VVEKLRELNPKYDLEFTHKVEGNAVVEFAVRTDHILDAWPIRALPKMPAPRFSIQPR